MSALALALPLLGAALASSDPAPAPAARVVLSSSDSAMALENLPRVAITPTRTSVDGALITVETGSPRQEILGFGGTFSESAARNLKALPEAVRTEVLRAYFDTQKGAAWTIVRTAMGSGDASTRHSTYAESPGATPLEHFSVRVDLESGVIDGLKQILAVAGPDLRIQASAWTAPTWMKDPTPAPGGTLKPEFDGPWAEYVSKFITAYGEHGIPIWAVTPQNEPTAFTRGGETMGWTLERNLAWVRDHLGPRLAKDHPEVAVHIGDDQTDVVENWASAFMGDEKARAFVDGIATQGSSSGAGTGYAPVRRLRDAYPQTFIIASGPGTRGALLREPGPAEGFAADIIGNLNHGTNAWVCRGMLFDLEGLPGEAKSPSHSPIMVDPAAGKVVYNPSFSYIAQFSRHMPRGSRVLAVSVDAAGKVAQPSSAAEPNAPTPTEVEATAAVQPDGTVAVVVLNRTALLKTPSVRATAPNAPDRFFTITLPPRSIATVLMPPL